MKSIFLHGLFVFITIGALAQKKVTEIIKEYYPKTIENPIAVVRSEGELTHILNKYGNKTSSSRNGTWRFYHSNGNLKEQIVYKDDKKNGYYVLYNADGSLLEQGEYKMNLKTGIWKTYKEGIVSSETSYANGVENGTFVSYVNGKTEVTGEYRNGIKINRWLIFDEKGNKIGQQTYDQVGMKKGRWEIPFFYNGDVTFGEYQNDERVGVWSVRNKEGKIIQTVDFDKGVSTNFSASGKKIAELRFSKSTSGKISLIDFSAYNDNGSKRIEGAFNSSKIYSDAELLGYEKEVNDLLNKQEEDYEDEYRYESDAIISAKKLASPGYAVGIGIWKFYWEDGELATEYDLEENMVKVKSTRPKEKYVYSNGKGNYGKGNLVLFELDFVLFEKQFLIKISNLDLLDKKNDNILSYIGPRFSFGKSHRSGIWETFDSTGVLLNKANYNFVTNAIEGSFTAYFSNGKVKSEGKYDKDGKQTGIWTYYYSNGNKAEERPYENGVITGVVTNYYENGNIKDKGAFVEGKRVGVLEMFHPNGKLLGKRNFRNGEMVSQGSFFDENGEITLENGNGYLTEYYDTGIPSFKGNYRNGQRHGVSIWYFETGKTNEQLTYVNGVLNGNYQTHFQTGVLKERGVYASGKLSGSVEFFHPNGKLLGKNVFQNGVQTKVEDFFDESGNPILTNGNGIYYAYNNLGKVSFKANYLDYCRNGKAQWYYDNGQLEQEAIYKYSDAHKPNGLRWEVLSSYTKDGKQRNFGTLKNGNGTWITYDQNGKSTVTTYANGIAKQ